ncbi:MAG: hypothetical protein JST21_04625 [Bacteroidetes bacterium]|nr:hypothetical protein [Bacteroidota bacterium]
MCTVSDNLKLCTCKVKNVKQLKDYWILKRPTEKTLWVEGIILIPKGIDKKSDKLNQAIILKQLNNGNCFDIEIQHNENDILELHFSYKFEPENNQPLFFNSDYLVYAFKFEKGKWKIDEYDPFEMDFYEVHKGKIVSPSSKQSNNKKL